MASSDRSLKRIRIKTHEDIGRLYPLILDFHEHPEKAADVTDFVFKCRIERERYLRKTSLPDEWKAREAAREPAAGSPLWTAVTRIGLRADEEADWVKALSWMEPDVLTARRAALDRLEAPRQVQPWVNHQDSVFAHYAAGMLLTMCSSIETLVYEDNGTRSPVYGLLKRNNRGSLARANLQKLRNVDLLPMNDMILSDPRYYSELDVLRLVHLFHRLPSIDSVSADAVSPNNDAGFEDSFPPASSRIRRIRMNHVSFPSTVIAALVRMPKALGEFTCTTGGRSSLGDGHYLMFPETVGRALWCQRFSLTKLDLDLDQHITQQYHKRHAEGQDSESESEDDEPASEGESIGEASEARAETMKTKDLETGRIYNSTIGSLHDFDRLTHLRIGIQLLLGQKRYGQNLPDAPFRLIEAFPSSLEHLTIRGYTRGETAKYDEQIVELLELRAKRLPNLKVMEGIDETVPSGKDVRNPDQNPDQLWEPQPDADEW